MRYLIEGFRLYLMFLGTLALLGYRWNGLVNWPHVFKSIHGEEDQK